MNESVNIEPVLQTVTLTCETCNVFDFHSDLNALATDFDLPTVSILSDIESRQLAFCFDLDTVAIESTHSDPTFCETFDLSTSDIEPTYDIQNKLHDFEIIREFIKNLQMHLQPHMLPPSGLIPACVVKEDIRNTFRKCRTYV